MKNNHSTTEYFKQWQDIRLSDSSRQQMRDELLEYTNLHAVSEGVRVGVDGRSMERTPTRMSLLVSKYIVMPYVLLFALMLGGGTSLAAQGAMPDDFLYGVKTAVNEPVRAALTFGAEANANYQASLIAKRVQEAEELTSDSAFTAAAAADVSTNLRRHTAALAGAIERSDSARVNAALATATEDIERYNTLVQHDVALAVDLNTLGGTEVGASFASQLATREIDIDQFRIMTENRLNNLVTLVAEAERDISTAAYAQFTTTLDQATRLYNEAESSAEADARAAYIEVSELLGAVEAEISTLGTLEIDQMTGELIDIDFSRVPSSSRDNATTTDSTGSASASGSAAIQTNSAVDTGQSGSSATDSEAAVDVNGTIRLGQ